MSRTITASDEAALLEAVDALTSTVGPDNPPDRAIVKLAHDGGWTPGQTEIVANAYNTGQQLSQWRSGGPVLGRLAPFPLIDVPSAVASVRGRTVQAEDSRISPMYSRAPDRPAARPVVRAKAAAARPLLTEPAPEPTPLLRAVEVERRRAKVAIDERARRADDQADQMVAHMTKVAAYLRRVDRPSLSQLRHATSVYLAPAAVALLDKTAAMTRVPDAGDRRWTPDLGPVRLTDEPFRSLDLAAKAAQACTELRQNLPAAEEAYRRTSFIPDVPVGPPAGGYIGQTKRAGVFVAPALGTGIGTAIGRTLGQMGTTQDSMVNNAMEKLDSPAHANELRKIRAHAMLAQLLTDDSDPISGYDPDQVVGAFNEISAATPRLAETIHTLRPALRRKLQGREQPFEAKELLEIERGLQTSRQSPKGMALPAPEQPAF